MRVKLALLLAGTAGAAAVAITLAAPSATAIECRLGFTYQVVTTVEGRQVGACLPPKSPPCDPGPCTPPPTAVAPR